MSFNRKQKRLNNKITSKLNPKEKENLQILMAMEATDKAIKQITPKMIEQGAQTAFIMIYDGFMKSIDNAEISVSDRADKIEEMLSYIRKEYLHAISEREKAKETVKQSKETLNNESEEQND